MTSARILAPLARISKLRAMSGAEIVHRLRYRTVIAWERRQHRRNRLAPPGRLRDALVDRGRAASWRDSLLEARRRRRARFLPSVDQREAIRALFQSRFHGERAETETYAARARDHRFEFFGQQFAYGAPIPWQSDPVSCRAWPAVFHADVPVHGGDVGFGDVKYVWELNRHQFLIDLGKSSFLTGAEEDTRAIARLVRDWIAGNPVGTGVNWSCALEPAFRIFSWLWAYYLGLDELDDQFHVEWLESFLDHGRFIERHLERYSSPYNHLVAEAAALFMLGTCFPEFRDAARWRSTGKTVLWERLPEQFYADGGSVEQSTFYHHATVGSYILAGLTARAHGDDLPPSVWSAVERGLEFSMRLTQPDGSTPSIGGADDGKPIRMEHLPFWDFRPYLSIGAVVFNRSDFKAVAGRFHEDSLWLLGSDGLRAFDALPATVPAETSCALPASGYFVMRSDWTSGADYVCFDCGEQAAGMRTDAVPNSMHGHADCLSVVAWLDGTRTLVDSGLYAYNCGGEWEDHFRETAAHNTARIDGRDQARHIRKMAWSHSYRASQEGWHVGDDGCWAVGAHDGYARGPEGVTHRRTVWLRPDGCLVIHDEFDGDDWHDLEINFQFAPGTLEPVRGGGALFDGVVDIAWSEATDWKMRIACGGEHPQDGWIAPSLGIRQAAPRLTLSRRIAGRHTSLLTVLAARTRDGSRISTFDTAQALRDLAAREARSEAPK